MADITEWLKTIDPVSFILGTAFSVFVGTFYGHFIKRPKLQYVGGGNGRIADGFRATNIRIRNTPGFLGLKIGDTTLFGWRIHNYKEIGTSFDREPARDCRALLFDKTGREIVCPLYWQSPGNPEAWQDVVTLNTGEDAALLLFARQEEELLKYFPYQPEKQGAITPKVPVDEAKFKDTQDFLVEIRYSYSKRTLRLPCTMAKGIDGRLQFKIGNGAGSF